MKSLIVTVLMLFLLPVYVQAAEPPLPTDPLAIRNELRSLRKKTADNDKKVRARIDVLMKQLQKLQAQRDAAESQARGEARPEVDDDKAVMTRETLWKKVQEAEAKGKGAEIDLAEPVREKIVKEYEEDRDPAIKNESIYESQPVLVIDFSRKGASVLVDLLDKFTGVKTLVLTGGTHGAPVDLPKVLVKAKHLPLTELYIFNFKNHLSTIPESIGAFTNLESLSMFNNNLSSIPAAIGSMQKLKLLHLDINPITTVLPTLRKRPTLQELGIGKTRITLNEQAQLQKLLPDCRIVTQ